MKKIWGKRVLLPDGWSDNTLVEIDAKGKIKEIKKNVRPSYNTFDTGIVSDASLLPGANGKFDLYVPQDFGTFIGYSYVIDWEEYQ